MSKSISLLRKALVSIIGFPIILLGIILVPLPGPGLLVMLLGLFIVSLEFDWAKKYVDNIRGKLGGLYDAAKQRADKMGGDSTDDSRPKR